MPKKKKNKSAPGRDKRLSFPADEKNRSWLALLLEGYHIVDKGVANAIAAEKKKGRKLACAKGCAHCCSTHQDIPVYPLEISGISWYVTEKIKGAVRDVLKKQLADFKKHDSCPFLIDGACSIHPVRPMACRQFNVFGNPCKEGEDPFYTRREDVMDPVKKHVDQVHRMVKELQACNWNELAEKMERHDSAKEQ
jgi:Fe-S-cluster containining protein